VKHVSFESIVIIGDGPIGLMQLMLLRIYFPLKKITVIGKVNHRLESAKELGADFVYNLSNEDISKESVKIKSLLDNKGPNLIFISNNNPKSIDLAINFVNKNGVIVIFSGMKGEKVTTKDNSLKIDANYIHYNQITVFGSFSSNPFDFVEAIEMVKAGKVKLSRLITHKFSLDKLQDALITTENFLGLKAVINRF
jgi:L-iditol 2-dehydrogenase